MGLFSKKKTKESEKTKTVQPEKAKTREPEKGDSERKEYIRGAGGSIVSNSILNGSARLKWLFRQETEHGNGWVAFGDTDTQEYVDDANNMSVVDFNTLADIEPAVLNVFYMPVGSDLEFRSDKTGKYFVDTKTGQEIREMVKHPVQIAFEKNLKFINQENYPLEFFRMLFTDSGKIQVFRAGETDFPTGEVVLADPIAYLGSRYQTVLERRVPAGRYPVELSICRSEIAGLRIAAARILLGANPAVEYEIAMPKGRQREDLGKPGVFTFFGVDAGLACFADVQTAREYASFFESWQGGDPGKNKYADYFAELFAKSCETNPALQNLGGSFLDWEIPGSGHRMALFSSGMGDGVYSGYWGLDAAGEAACLTVIFMNPEYF